MNNKNFLRLILALIILFLGLYLVMPKYEYIDDQTPDLLRFNKITGNLEVCKDGEHWYRVVSKSVARVERPTISYDEFIQGRNQSQEALQTLEMMKRKINQNK